MSQFDGAAFGAEIIQAVKAYVDPLKRELDVAIAENTRLKARLEALEARAMVPGPQGPAGKDGAVGAPGEVGKDGAPGRDGAHGRDGKDGKDGRDGMPGTTGPRGEKGDPGPKGDQGASGRDGKDGANGVTMDDLDLVQESRSVLVKCRSTGRLVGRLYFPIPTYRGVYKDGMTCEPGDMVTHGGSVWHCQEATTTRPGDGAPWQLAVKRGRDGRDTPREAA